MHKNNSYFVYIYFYKFEIIDNYIYLCLIIVLMPSLYTVGRGARSVRYTGRLGGCMQRIVIAHVFIRDKNQQKL